MQRTCLKSTQQFVHHTDLSTLTWTPVVVRFPWDIVFGYVSQGNITVPGDAKHPMTPNLGQNECLALEDACCRLGTPIWGVDHRPRAKVLCQELEVVKALGRYARQRRWRAVGLMTSSYLSSFVAQGGSGRMMKFSRDKVFNRFLYNSICSVIHFYCGKLPNMSSKR
ncbi:hypothetical protein M0R45_005491 [Rubus argutus]|uniref:FAD-binding domain-containing protein n=1 Tax=Rubus argutus TaxID=59490 RepID=A0AAW1YNC0_RUBAR